MNKTGKQITNEMDNSTSGENKNSPELNETLETLLNGEDLYETVETKRGSFTIKYPRPKVLRQIQLLLASRFHGQNLNHIPQQTIRNYEVYASLDIVITEAPKWWNELETSEDCPDDAFIMDLYGRYLRFYNRIQQKIGNTGTEHGKSYRKKSGSSKKEVVDHGTFQGLTHG